jgi:hypothetical protein
MRLNIIDGKDRISIPLPGFMAMNGGAIYLFFRINKQPVTFRQARLMAKGMRAVKRKCANMPLVEIKARDTYVRLDP